MAARHNRSPICAARQLGGFVSVLAQRDRCGEGLVFRISHMSAAGDVAFLSSAVLIEDQANGAARVLAEFVGAKEIKLAP
jgi:hypothetical protein